VSCNLQAQLDATEKTVIQQALTESSSIRQAAKILGVSHATLLRHMQKYNLKSNSV
jgi:transcriptional regulator with PAS, ATPase and Fis domain